MRIHRLKLPDVLFTREVNAYLINEPPVTLIDTGPNTKEAFSALSRSLDSHGLAVKDIERVILTHSHPDHCGLVRKIKDASGAVVLANKHIKLWLEHYLDQWNLGTLKIMKLMSTYKVPRSYISAVAMIVRPYRKLGEASSVDIEIESGDQINFGGFNLRVYDIPGHTYWCLALFEPSERILFSGDLLNEKLTCHPFMQPVGEDPFLWPNQVQMIHTSLAVVESLDAQVAYGGHGEQVSSTEHVREKIFECHEAKRSRILKTLEEGASTLFSINQKVHSFKTPVEQLVGIFETLHHLHWLEENEKVVEQDFLFELP